MNHAAGIVCLAKPGDEVAAGQPILELRTDDQTRFGPAIAALAGATAVGADPPAAGPLVLERVTSG